MTDHLLDRPFWNALRSRQSHLAEGGPVDVAVAELDQEQAPGLIAGLVADLADTAVLEPAGGGIFQAQFLRRPLEGIGFVADGAGID